MVYDCFQFFNEVDILALRLHIMSGIADKFVISESTVTFSGDPKPLFFEKYRDQFKEFEDRIIHVVVDDTPMDCDAYERDHHQKCAVARGLAEAQPDDIVIFSDVDEIPDPETLRDLLPKVEDGKIYMLAQRLFYCYLNLEDVSGKHLSVTGDFEDADPRMWLGTKICKKSLLDRYTTEELRNAEQREIGVRVPNGGWHFSYVGGTPDVSVEDRVRYKIRSAAHQNYNNRRTLYEVTSRIHKREDILGRDGGRMEVRTIDEGYPAYLREHLADYEYLLYKEPKWYQRLWDAVSVGAIECRAKLLNLKNRG